MRRIIGALLVIGTVLSLTWHTTGEAKSVDTYKVFADSLNVRSEPSGKAEIAGSLKQGELVTGLKEQHGWLQIRSDRVSGWVAGYYLKKINGSAAGVQTASSKSGKSSAGSVGVNVNTSRTVSVLADSLRLRTGPGLGHPVAGALVQGDSLTVIDGQGDWVQVRAAGGLTGWVSAAFVGDAGEAAAAAPAAASAGSGLKGKLIVVDPGHGGSDPGMLGTTYDTIEKDLTLSTSLKLADALRARGARVILTRTTDSQKPELSKRVQISEVNRADAFVSIHYNSSTKKTSGTLTFYYSGTKDEPLARAIEGNLKRGIGLKSNGVAFGDYHVLRENDTPSALVELGFLSNPKDEKLVQTSGYQSKAALAIAEGLRQYFA